MSDSNAAGQAYSLTVVAPVLHGHEGPLRECLAGFGVGPESPLAALASVHFARWVVFSLPGERSDAGAYLLFDACLDGPIEAFFDAMRGRMRDQADAVWHHCRGYAGSSDPEAFASFFRRHQVNALLFLAAYPAATVQDVRASLSLRQRIIDFAMTTQGLEPPALLSAYRDAFGGRAT